MRKKQSSQIISDGLRYNPNSSLSPLKLQQKPALLLRGCHRGLELAVVEELAVATAPALICNFLRRHGKVEILRQVEAGLPPPTLPAEIPWQRQS